jgi:hypothetical protein
MSNYVLVRADRTTHLKIIAVSLLAAFLVIGIGVTARPPASLTGLQADDNAIAVKPAKSAKPATWSSRESAIIR